jgi:putative transposase
MPRIRRVCPPGAAQHVLNRGNDKKTIFHKIGDYLAFLRLLAEAQQLYPMLLLAYCLMPNHFHLILIPESTEALSAYMRWLMNAHVRRYHHHYESSGTGHICQGRYKNFPIQTDGHLLRVWTYVEANALRARLVRRAEHWRWSSLSADQSIVRPTLGESPVAKPTSWVDLVNQRMEVDALASIRRSVVRGAPYGEERWRVSVAKEYGLEFTLREPGRPRK